ncbi:hypothetical protein LTS09_000292 [Friedmanniomyces endolithicus]|nr:hypothetical protein LTS09_000292 [Friedmanniomyces endolithicus]
MASLASRSLLRSSIRARYSYTCPHCRHYASPSTPSAPPLLLRIRSDLKTAMQQKDKTRLAVVRALLADVMNAAKTSSPIQTDMQLLSLLRKRVAAAQTAKAEFAGAGRQDLVEQEEQQAKVLEEYAGGVETLGADSVRDSVQRVVEEGKAALAAGAKAANMGDVLKKLLGAGGSLEGKNVERSEVARIVKQMMGPTPMIATGASP